MGRAKHTSRLRSVDNPVVSVPSQQIYSRLKMCCYVEVINCVFSLSVQCKKKKFAIIFRSSNVYSVLVPT
jgi:vacuolar-type H+-ATPase subunit D/Vma8